jgi:mycothiol synthase
VSVQTFDHTDADIRAAVRAIQQAARRADGTAPFSEAVVLRWVDGAAPATEMHLLARTASGQVAGYAHLDGTGTAELAVHPDLRRQGHGTALLAALRATGGRLEVRLEVWAHGDRPAARAFAAATGFRAVRELLQLRRPLEDDPAPAGVRLPAGVAVRSFRPGVDDEEWLALNARAFAHHPEQGRLTQADLDARMAEPWFDPEGFLIATDGPDGAMIGYHWTKVHPGGLGEVYVLGVDPERHGAGLGAALTMAGLHHLYRKKLRTVLLYVEADNAPALAVYTRLGFSRWDADVMYAPSGIGRPGVTRAGH